MTNRVRRWSLILIGLGPLVRPDIGVMTLTALVAWFLLVRPRRVVHDLAIALAVPIAYEVFRMGYFANLVPNTALAKDSSGFYLQQGWHYLTDLTNTYALWIPLAVIAAVLIGEAVESHDRRRTVACGAIVLGGLLHGAYIVVSGGDYMHGRLLLPSLFAVALPAAVALPLRRSRVVGLLATGAVAAVVIWSAVVIAAVRYPATPPAYFGVADISDWRNLLHGQMFHHATMPKGVKNLGISAAQVHALYEAGARGFLHVFDTKPRPGRDPHKLVVTMGSIGVPGWAVGPDVFVVDIGGLAEPLAARSSPVPNQAAGHRKRVSATWYEARFGVQRGDPRVDAARRALRCQPLAGLIRAIDAPLTPGRFLSNLWHAPSYTFLHIARDPRVAERELCPHPGTR